MTKDTEKNPLFFLFWLGVILIPVIEIYRSFFGHAIQVFGIAAEEALLLLFWLGLFAAALVFAFKERRYRPLFSALGVTAVFFLYLILHGLNAARFDASLFPSAEPSLFKESYYLIRMYFAPMTLVLSAYLIRLPRKTLFSALKSAGIVISLAVVIPCLFGFSFASYADGNVVVNGGFFSWFSLGEDAQFARYTAKGLFSDANAVGAILFGIFPFVAADALRKRSFNDLAAVFLTGFAAVAVGTKIASFGVFLSSAALFAVALLSLFLKKEGRKEAFLRLSAFSLTVLFLVPIFFFSPGKRLQEQREWEEETTDRPTENLGEIEDLIDELMKSEVLSEEEILLLEEYVNENYWDHFIDPWFLELYPVKTDPQFWLQAVARENHSNADSRIFKLEMVNRVMARNENPLDPVLGIGHSAGTPYAEKDFLGQYPLFGAAGLLVLIAPYFALLGLGVICSLKALLKRSDLISAAVPTLATASFLVAAYFAGHVFDTLFTTYFLAAAGAVLVSLRCRDDR